MNAARGPNAPTLLEGVRRGDSLSVARAITAIENGTAVGVELRLAVHGSRCRTLGVTGPPGAGKSSLINALIPELLPCYRKIGVLTVDPSSPVSGGAVLGDRVRMAAHSANPNLFIRSLAARGHLGGVTRTTQAVIDLLAAAGIDLVIVETVGTGQSEVEVAGLTDVKIVVCAPGLGDEMQAIKAGVLEIADLLVVNKADLPDADRTANHLGAMLHCTGHEERRRLLKVSTVKGEGVTGLVEAIEAMFADLPTATSMIETVVDDSRQMLSRDVVDLAAAWLRDEVDARLDDITEGMARGVLSRSDGAMAAIRLLSERDSAHATQSGRGSAILTTGKLP